MTIDIHLRDILDGDFAILFEHRRDPAAVHMAAFAAEDESASALAARWRPGLADGSTIAKAIILDGDVVGYVTIFVYEGKPHVGYTIARSHWGRGIASAALSQLLQCVTTRPLYADAAKDNVASLRVLEKCGFTVRGSGMTFANARGEEIEEIFLELR